MLSIEALSRGASRALAIDCNYRSVAAMKAVRARLDAQALEVRLVWAEEFLGAPNGADYDIVFVDPPFDLGIQRSICEQLEEFGWLSPDALIYIEAPGGEDVATPQTWLELKRKQAGNVIYALFQAAGG